MGLSGGRLDIVVISASRIDFANNVRAHVALVAPQNELPGARINAETNLPEWDGEPPQYAYVAEVMAATHARASCPPMPPSSR